MNTPSKIGVFSLLGAILLHFFLLTFFIYYDHIFSSLRNKSTNLHQIYPVHLYYYLPEKVNFRPKQKILENNQLPLLAPHNIPSTHTAAIQQKKSLHEFKRQPQPSFDNEKHQLSNLVALLHSQIQLHQQYPREAQLMHEDGVSTVEFNLQLNGEITNVHIIESSENESIDNAALDAVKNSSPMELNSENISFLKKNSHIFKLKIAFNLG